MTGEMIGTLATRDAPRTLHRTVGVGAALLASLLAPASPARAEVTPAPAPPPLSAPVAQGSTDWRFAPARRGETPVAARIRAARPDYFSAPRITSMMRLSFSPA